MSIFDSHCHLQFPQYDSDREEVIKRTLEEGVFMITVGSDLENSKKAIELAEQYGGIWATVGLHPDDIKENFKISDFRNLAGADKVVAIGEVGLDYYRTPEPEKRGRQKEVFLEFLNLSTEFKKPLVIHCRNSKSGESAYADMVKLLNNKLSGVVHSFAGNLEEAKKFLDLGFYLGFNGIITFTDDYDEVVRYAPLEQILLETDAPYLSPEPYRGKRNEPVRVREVAKRIAEIKDISIEEIFNQTTENCRKLFNLKF